MVSLLILSKMYKYEKKWTLLIVYFYSLIISSIFSELYVLYINNLMVLGSSGAIFGVFSYIFFKINKQKEFYLNFIIFNLGMVLMGLNIAWFSHLGGAIAGIIYYYLKRKKGEIK
jgi:membrane associated rhomboid family serine protease